MNMNTSNQVNAYGTRVSDSNKTCRSYRSNQNNEDTATRSYRNFLNQVNPAIKALSIIVCICILSFALDYVTFLSFSLFTLILTWTFGVFNWRKWLLLLIPFTFLAFGYFMTAILFPNQASIKEHVLFSWGFIQLHASTLQHAVALALRPLTYCMLSLLFILTTEPVVFIFSLMQQCKLSPKLAYGILAGYRFLPLFRQELTIIQQAHRIRGAGPKQNKIANFFYNIKRSTIPLFASAIRKSERLAVAMISRGFTGDKNRDYYVKLHITWRDWLFFGIMLCGVVAAYTLSYSVGTLNWVGR